MRYRLHDPLTILVVFQVTPIVDYLFQITALSAFLFYINSPRVQYVKENYYVFVYRFLKTWVTMLNHRYTNIAMSYFK